MDERRQENGCVAGSRRDWHLIQFVSVKINGCRLSGAEDILNFDRFGPLKTCEGRIHVSHAYKL
jgi:hypothetical protein